MSALDPPMSPWSEPFWSATRERRFVAQHCAACDRWVHLPRPRCPRCWGDALTWAEPELEPRLYSWALHPARGETPGRIVALVQATPVIRVVSNLVGLGAAAIDELRIDEPLELTWEPLPDGRALPQFRRASPTGRSPESR